MDEFNHKLWEERHYNIKEEFKDMDGRIKKVENRFITILTLLIANLIGISGTLFIILVK